jgi:hypothetical protein
MFSFHFPRAGGKQYPRLGEKGDGDPALTKINRRVRSCGGLTLRLHVGSSVRRPQRYFSRQAWRKERTGDREKHMSTYGTDDPVVFILLSEAVVIAVVSVAIVVTLTVKAGLRGLKAK